MVPTEQPAFRSRTFPHTDAVLTRVDWFRLLAELLKAGKSRLSIARETGIPESTIRGWWLWDHEPRHYHGEQMLAYWSRITGRPPADAPRKRRFTRAR